MKDSVSEFLDQEIARIHARKHQTPPPRIKTRAPSELAALHSRLKGKEQKESMGAGDRHDAKR